MLINWTSDATSVIHCWENNVLCTTCKFKIAFKKIFLANCKSQQSHILVFSVAKVPEKLLASTL